MPHPGGEGRPGTAGDAGARDAGGPCGQRDCRAEPDPDGRGTQPDGPMGEDRGGSVRGCRGSACPGWRGPAGGAGAGLRAGGRRAAGSGGH